MSSCNASFDNKKKVIFILGATGAGKSRLSVDLATHLNGEIINSDKMQVFKGLDIVTNKISEAEMRGVKHHLLGEIDPHTDFTACDFCYEAMSAIAMIQKSDRIPIIVGGSNSFIEALVDHPFFKSIYDSCFIWLDVSLPVLFSFVSERVDQMVDAGLVNEVREMFVPGADYTRGIRQSIGVPELENYFIEEPKLKEETEKKMLLESAIADIKENTCKLVTRQIGKILRLRNELRWPIHHLDATKAFEKRGTNEAKSAWKDLVVKPCLEISTEFLKDEEQKIVVAAETVRASIPI